MGCLEGMKFSRNPRDLIEAELLNHCVVHRTSFLCAALLEEEHELKVCRSGAGFYLGAMSVMGEPLARDSQQYWDLEVNAKKALEERRWTQRLDP